MSENNYYYSVSYVDSQKKTQMASAFDELSEQSVLTLHFRFNGELVVDVDGTVVGTVGVVPRAFSHVFPLIDLYGRVHQVTAPVYASLRILTSKVLAISLLKVPHPKGLRSVTYVSVRLLFTFTAK